MASSLLCRLKCACSILALWLSNLPCSAHPDLMEQITSLTQQLSEHDDSPALFLKRADLFRRHAQFDAALADIATAERLQTNTAGLNLDRARVLCDARRAAESYEEIQPFLQTNPNHGEALIIRARCHALLGHAEASVVDYNNGIPRCLAPGPDLFLERARQQALLGKFDDAAHGLDEAITNSPTFSALQLAAVDYDRKRGAFDSALKRVAVFVNQYPVKEPWLTLRAEVLEQAGRAKEATETFQQVIAGIEKYPAIRRGLDLTRQLEQRAREGIARVQINARTVSKS